MRKSVRSGSFLVSLLGLLSVLSGCPDGERALSEFASVIGFAYEDTAVLNSNGTVTEADPANGIRFSGWTGNVLTTLTSESIGPFDFGGDPDFVRGAGAGISFTASPPLTGDLGVELKVGQWAGTGFDFELWAAVAYHQDGSVDLAEGQEFTYDDAGQSWLKFQLKPDMLKVLIYPLNGHVYGTAKSEAGVEDPALDPGELLNSEFRADWNAAAGPKTSGSGQICDDTGVWTPEDLHLPTCEPATLDGMRAMWSRMRSFRCNHATSSGPSIRVLLDNWGLKHGNTVLAGTDGYEAQIGIRARVIEASLSISGTGFDQLSRVRSSQFAEQSGLGLAFVAESGSADLLDLRSGGKVKVLPGFVGFLGATAVSTGSLLQATQLDAALGYGNSGYGINHYDPAIQNFGFTEVDPNSGSVSDADTCEEDPSRAVLVQSGRNQVRFVETVTDPVLGLRFRALDAAVKAIPSTLFPGATGFVISAARRNDTSPVWFVTVGPTSNDPGQLWRKNDPTDLVTPATLIGSVGNAPKRIRFLKTVGVVSNSASNTLTILARDAANNVTIKGTVPVGQGPIGVDLIELLNGNIAVVSTGSLDNTYTITVLEPDGDTVSNVTRVVPDGGLKPVSAVWADEEGSRIAVSCNGSNLVMVFSVE